MLHSALLNLDNAVAHLYHFCAVLPASQYTDRRPKFINSDDEPMRVLLPLCLDKAVRQASAQRLWLTEKNAKKDAAFQAYMSLYNHGLVDDHLMPLLRYDAIQNEFASGVEKRPSIVNASAQVDPWLEIATALYNRADERPVWRYVVTVEDANNQVLSSAEMVLPIAFDGIHHLRLYWDADTEMRVTVNPPTLDSRSGNKVLSLAQEQTREILTAAFGWRLPIEKDSLVVPFVFTDDHTNICDQKRYEIVTENFPLKREKPFPYIVRDTGEKYKPYVFNEYLQQKPAADSVKHTRRGYEELPTDVPYVALSSLPRRIDFLHKIPKVSQPPSEKHYSHVLPVTRCIFDKLPLGTLQFALLIPSIIYRLGGYIVADLLCNTILKDVGFRDRSLVVTAISASSTAQETNYQRLEFLGDSILKTCTSLQVLGDNPLWHEGYLSAKKDRIVANSRLARAALHVGLDKFILTTGFASRKWRPMYLQQVLSSNSMETTREMSTKVLADVVEALIGAAVIDGGMPKALACMRVFLPELKWESLEFRRDQIFERVEVDVRLPDHLEPLEELIGYTFTKKSLLIEAMTHASCNTGVGSFERLEFLGDSILDNIIVATIYSHDTELSHVQMHYLRTALVNADLLAFVCMEWAATQEAGGVLKDRNTNCFRPTSSTIRLPLWRFMGQNSQVLSKARRETAERHSKLRDDIYAAIERGSYYPWAQLSRLQAPKFFSDIVESLLGAIYIDSGSDKFCKGVLEQTGILPYLRRIIADGVRIIHPKEELGILADTEEVKYVVRLEERIVDTVRMKEYTCEVFVGDRSVVIVGGGVGKEEVMTKAAESAVKVLNMQSSRKCIDPDRGGYRLRKTNEDGAVE
jgi:dsRNA-specific ribonuclease